MTGFYDSLLEAGFADVGGLYPVNPKVNEINGARCYPSLLDTPDPVDHVISQVPAAVVPELVDQCVAKKVRSIHFFTAGFSETGDEEMARVERYFDQSEDPASVTARVVAPDTPALIESDVPAVPVAPEGLASSMT